MSVDTTQQKISEWYYFKVYASVSRYAISQVTWDMVTQAMREWREHVEDDRYETISDVEFGDIVVSYLDLTATADKRAWSKYFGQLAGDPHDRSEADGPAISLTLLESFTGLETYATVYGSGMVATAAYNMLCRVLTTAATYRADDNAYVGVYTYEAIRHTYTSTPPAVEAKAVDSVVPRSPVVNDFL